ncbi:MAG: hypothetical protein AAGH15_11895 [Myxococcota bacterium]
MIAWAASPLARASSRISPATTAKPLPSCAARAASMEAFSESMRHCSAMSSMLAARRCMSRTVSATSTS